MKVRTERVAYVFFSICDTVQEGIQVTLAATFAYGNVATLE